MITLTNKQANAWINILDNPKYTRILFDGGARCGKTVLICAWLLHQAYTYPGLRILVARKHRNAAEKSIYSDTFRRLCRDRSDIKLVDSKLDIELSNGSTIQIDGLDDDDRIQKILGREFGIIFLNEATEISYDTTQVVLSRLTQSIIPVRKLILDCNPRNTSHWIYKAFMLHQNPDDTPLKAIEKYARLSWKPQDNPYLPADAIETLSNLTGIQRRRLFESQWCSAEGLVYDEFEDGIHVIDQMPDGWKNWGRVYGSIDFGFVNAFGYLQGVLDSDGRLFIFNEYKKSQQIVSEHANVIKNMNSDISGATIVADCADAEGRATLQRCGITTLPAHKAVIPGIEAVKARLKVQKDGKPRLFIVKRCKNLIDEMRNYAWAKSPEGKTQKEEPLKVNDHLMDALRYMVSHIDIKEGAWGRSGVVLR